MSDTSEEDRAENYVRNNWYDDLPGGYLHWVRRERARALEDDQVFFNFDPDALVDIHETGVVSLVSQSDKQISTPDDSFTGRVVDVGVAADGTVGMYITRTGAAQSESDESGE